jgi:hypothetical protein
MLAPSRATDGIAKVVGSVATPTMLKKEDVEAGRFGLRISVSANYLRCLIANNRTNYSTYH